MRILQLSSDWKWTGPAQPLLVLAEALRARGHAVDVVCPEPPLTSGRSLAEEARARGFEPSLVLPRGRSALRRGDAIEAQRIRSLALRRGYDVVHCWHSRDHVLAQRALRPLRRRGVCALVRSRQETGALPRWPWQRRLFVQGADGLLCVSPETARRVLPSRRGRPIAGPLGAVEPPPPVDPARVGQVRETLGVPAQAPLVGIVARVQRHRRFDLLLRAMRVLVDERPDARLLVIGRGTRLDRLARRPARRLGLEENVVFAGYREADYLDVLRCLDVFTYLVPGSDGSCRALLEAAACGLPAVTTRRGALPEIVVDGETGCLVDEDAEALAAGWRTLLCDAGLRKQMGEAAARRARETFSPDRQAEGVEALYLQAHEWVAHRAWTSGRTPRPDPLVLDEEVEPGTGSAGC